MTIYDELIELYKKCPERDMQKDLERCFRNGYVLSGPDHFIAGWRVGKGWFIHCAIGRGALRRFARLMPYYLPFIGWAREAKGRKDVIWHPTDQVFRRIGMRLTIEQTSEQCRYGAPNLVAQYREE